MHLYVILLKFNTSDHAIDCEALLAGLAASVSKGMKDLHVFMDLPKLVSQTKGNHTPAMEKERKYKKEIMDATTPFYRISQLGSIDGYQNKTIGGRDKQQQEGKSSKQCTRLVPSCFVIFDLKPLSLSLDFFKHEHVVMNPTLAGMRHHHLHLYVSCDQFSLSERLKADNTVKVNQIVTIFLIMSSIHLLDLYQYLVDTSLIHIESRNSPTAVLSDDDTGRISIRHCEY
ncbi:hypothetical protein Tco_0983936 [Tanacetum coccineum]